MYLKQIGLWLVLSIALVLQGCTLLCRVNCRHVEYQQVPCNTAPCKIFPKPCPLVNFPGFYPSDYNCIERLRKLTTLRQRGIGLIVLGDRFRIILPFDNLFTRDSIEGCHVDINECYLTTLADIADIIKCIPGVPVVITGHTDDVGTAQDKFRKSYLMAQAVAGHLWAQGVTYDRLRVIGRGDCDPISSDGSVFGSTDNRRVEIRVDFSRNYLWNCRYNNIYCPDCIGKRAH